MSLQHRSRAFYRSVLLLPLGMAVYLTASGRFAEYWHMFTAAQQQPPGPEEFSRSMVTAVLWLAAVTPLMFTAFTLGKEHTAARRLNYEVLVGLREVFRRALGRGASGEGTVANSHAPRDNPQAALCWGAAISVVLPTFFASFLPWLRNPPGLVWLFGAGLLMGTIAYGRRRAVAYLREEPGRWDLFREYRLLNPARYDDSGRKFVRLQITASVLLPIWWLGGGSLVMFSQ